MKINATGLSHACMRINRALPPYLLTDSIPCELQQIYQWYSNASTSDCA
jgi:hypothetical protein